VGPSSVKNAPCSCEDYTNVHLSDSIVYRSTCSKDGEEQTNSGCATRMTFLLVHRFEFSTYLSLTIHEPEVGFSLQTITVHRVVHNI